MSLSVEKNRGLVEAPYNLPISAFEFAVLSVGYPLNCSTN